MEKEHKKEEIRRISTLQNKNIKVRAKMPVFFDIFALFGCA